LSTFLGIGAGPIQTGIFVRGASRGGFDRIVLADVDQELIQAVRVSTSITANTACRDSVRTDTYSNVEIYNPGDSADLEILKKVAAEALAICTALPSTAFYKHVAPWLTPAFASAPHKTRYVYTAENSTTAADDLRQAVGTFPNTYYLDTVIGKMSKVFTASESDLPTLSPGLNRGHLVEEFNDIYTSSAPGIRQVTIEGLYPKETLEPFEEAKLYGHNTTHYMLAILASQRDCQYMDEAAKHSDLIGLTTRVLIEECGSALCKKYTGDDPFFHSENFRNFAVVLVERMTSPTLRDSIERVVRDPQRKLSWNDRMIGAVRLCQSQGIQPANLLGAVAVAARSCFGPDCPAVAAGLTRLWTGAPKKEVDPLIKEIIDHVC
jgi:mannitol-1-phosphate 5-dehydrogenase